MLLLLKRYSDARFQDIFTTLYNDYKLEMGYSHEEILNKTRSFERGNGAIFN